MEWRDFFASGAAARLPKPAMDFGSGFLGGTGVSGWGEERIL